MTLQPVPVTTVLPFILLPGRPETPSTKPVFFALWPEMIKKTGGFLKEVPADFAHLNVYPFSLALDHLTNTYQALIFSRPIKLSKQNFDKNRFTCFVFLEPEIMEKFPNDAVRDTLFNIFCEYLFFGYGCGSWDEKDKYPGVWYAQKEKRNWLGVSGTMFSIHGWFENREGLDKAVAYLKKTNSKNTKAPFLSEYPTHVEDIMLQKFGAEGDSDLSKTRLLAANLNLLAPIGALGMFIYDKE